MELVSRFKHNKISLTKIIKKVYLQKSQYNNQKFRKIQKRRLNKMMKL